MRWIKKCIPTVAIMGIELIFVFPIVFPVQKGSHALVFIRVLEQDSLALGFEIHSGFIVKSCALADQFFGVCYRNRTVAHDLGCDLDRHGHDLLIFYQMIRPTKDSGLSRVQNHSCEDHLSGLANADELWQPNAATGTGNNAQANLGLTYAGRFTDNADITGIASSQPPPNAQPSTAAIVGEGKVSILWNSPELILIKASCRRRSRSSEMSAPLTKLL